MGGFRGELTFGVYVQLMVCESSVVGFPPRWVRGCGRRIGVGGWSPLAVRRFVTRGTLRTDRHVVQVGKFVTTGSTIITSSGNKTVEVCSRQKTKER